MYALSVDIMTLLPTESGVIHLKASRIDQSQPQSPQFYFSDVPFGPTMVSTHLHMYMLMYVAIFRSLFLFGIKFCDFGYIVAI